MADLAARLSQLTDTRKKRGKIYPLGMIIALVIFAKLSGEDKPSGTTEWIWFHRDAFVTLFNFKHQRMLCLNIIRGALEKIVSLEELEKILNRYLHETYGGQESELLTML